MECTASLDQGTQSTRFLLYDVNAKLIVRHQIEFTQITPQPGCGILPFREAANGQCPMISGTAGCLTICVSAHVQLACRWVEHDPLEIWNSVLQCIEKGLSAAREKHADIRVVGLGITNQRETTMAWDSKTGVLPYLAYCAACVLCTACIGPLLCDSMGALHVQTTFIRFHAGQPLHNAIVWMDRRTAAICQRLTKELGSAVRVLTCPTPPNSRAQASTQCDIIGRANQHCVCWDIVSKLSTSSAGMALVPLGLQRSAVCKSSVTYFHP